MEDVSFKTVKSTKATGRILRSQVTTTPKNKERTRTRSPLRSDADSDVDSESSRASSRSRKATLPKGSGAGIARARANLREANEEAKEEAFNIFLRDRVGRNKIPEPVLEPDNSILETTRDDPSKLSVEELRAAAGQSVATLVQVATNSGHLKATFVKQFKDTAFALQELVDTLASRTEEEETRRLRKDNGRLRLEVENLKTELKAHRREFSEMRTLMATSAPPTSSVSGDQINELKASIVASVGVMLDARLAGIEERLLPEKVHRPPLAADKRRQATLRTEVSGTSSTCPVPQTEGATPSVPSEVAAENGPTEAMQVEDWATVVRKGKKGKKAPSVANAADAVSMAAAKRHQPVRLTTPKTAAVLITLQPEAAEKGVTYAQVLERAEELVSLQELGIDEGVRIRRAATGARLLELPKSQSPEQAELLASRLRIALDGVANVVRPTRSAALRLTGLDDSVSKDKVVNAIARAGNCPPQSIKVSEIQPGPRGAGTVVVHCPIEVTKTLSDAGRLLVGWSSAGVQVLAQRPLRCFRCLGIGHTRPVCLSPVDRSDLCFRCGCYGHKSSGCTSSMRCAICLDAGLPSEHIMGGRVCNPPLTRGRTVPLAPTATSAEGIHAQEETEMAS